jgi:sarcosine oxidase subunit alpha
MHDAVKYSPVHSAAEALGAQFYELDLWLIPRQYDEVGTEMAAADQTVALVDCSAYGKIRLEGARAATIVESESLTVHAGRETKFGQVYCLRSDLYFINTEPSDAPGTAEALSAAARAETALVTVSDITHGNAQLQLVGPHAAEVLSRLCGLDFHHDRFPNLSAKESSVAKTKQLILRCDLGNLPAYSLIGGRSFGIYLWNTIMQAGQDLGIRPMGQAAKRMLLTAE